MLYGINEYNRIPPKNNETPSWRFVNTIIEFLEELILVSQLA